MSPSMSFRGFIYRWAATDASAYEGRRLRQGLARQDQCSERGVGRYRLRPAANETFLNKNGFVSLVHRKKPRGHETMRRANNAKSKKFARMLSICSPSKRIGGYSSELSGSHEQRPGSEWPTSSTKSNALSSLREVAVAACVAHTQFGWFPGTSVPLKVTR